MTPTNKPLEANIPKDKKKKKVIIVIYNNLNAVHH